MSNHRSQYRFVKVSDDTMFPTFAEGCLIVIDQTVRRVGFSGIYAFEDDNGSVMIRRVDIRLDGSALCQCDSIFYPDCEIVPPELIERLTVAGLYVADIRFATKELAHDIIRHVMERTGQAQ